MNFTMNYSRSFGDHTVGGLFSIERSEAESEYLMGKVNEPYEFTTGQSNSATGDKILYSPVLSLAPCHTSVV